MVSQDTLGNLRDKVCRLLAETGFKVESDELTKIAVSKGCTISPSGRVRIPHQLIDEMVEFQKPRQARDAKDQQLLYDCGPDWAHHIIWHGQAEQMTSKMKDKFLMQAFDCGPTKYWDHQQQQSVSIDTDVFITAKKFAQSTDEVGYISTWYRTDVPAKIDFKIGKAIQVCDGKDVTLIGTGTITNRIVPAAELLAKQGINARVLSMHTVKPIDEQAIIAAAKETGAIVTVEEHQVTGGLGGAVAEVLADNGIGIPFKRIGLPDTYVHEVGSHDWLLDKYGFSPKNISQIAKELLK